MEVEDGGAEETEGNVVGQVVDDSSKIGIKDPILDLGPGYIQDLGQVGVAVVGVLGIGAWGWVGGGRVEKVAHNGRERVGEMHPQLVCPPCDGMCLHNGPLSVEHDDPC